LSPDQKKKFLCDANWSPEIEEMSIDHFNQHVPTSKKRKVPPILQTEKTAVNTPRYYQDANGKIQKRNTPTSDIHNSNYYKPVDLTKVFNSTRPKCIDCGEYYCDCTK